MVCFRFIDSYNHCLLLLLSSINHHILSYIIVLPTLLINHFPPDRDVDCFRLGNWNVWNRARCVLWVWAPVWGKVEMCEIGFRTFFSNGMCVCICWYIYIHIYIYVCIYIHMILYDCVYDDMICVCNDLDTNNQYIYNIYHMCIIF